MAQHPGTLVIWIPAKLPSASSSEAFRSVDLSPGSPVRKFIAEARALGIAVEFEDILANQLAGRTPPPNA